MLHSYRRTGAHHARPCAQCGVVYLPDHPDRPSSRYCSKKCYGKTLQADVEVTCSQCETVVIRKPSGAGGNRFCSRKCHVTYQRARIKPLATSGHKHEARTLRTSWMRQAYECRKRDGYKCQECGKQFVKGEGGLDAHHIVPWRNGGGDELANLISLCKRCHKKADQAIRAQERLKNPDERIVYVRHTPLPNHCKQGHEYTESNTLRRSDGGRRCRICLRSFETEYRKAYRANPANAERFKTYWRRSNLKRKMLRIEQSALA